LQWQSIPTDGCWWRPWISSLSADWGCCADQWNSFHQKNTVTSIQEFIRSTYCKIRGAFFVETNLKCKISFNTFSLYYWNLQKRYLTWNCTGKAHWLWAHSWFVCGRRATSILHWAPYIVSISQSICLKKWFIKTYFISNSFLVKN